MAVHKYTKGIACRGNNYLFASQRKRTGLSLSAVTSAFIFLLLSSCTSPDADKARTEGAFPDSLKLFRQLDSSATGISFSNNIIESQSMNPIVYEYTYNGGGVAIGDVNNDGLDDIFFTANQQANRLYLNKGGLKFEDITTASGTGGKPGCWKTGVTMADVNGDGLLDIYVCYSGDLPGNNRINELLMNKGVKNGIPVFQDEAIQWKLADSSYSTQACFFDYDRDGDLDMVLINHTPHVFENLDEANLNYLKKQRNSQTGLRLFRNTGNSFEDVTDKSGIVNTSLSFGLGVSVSDVNNDNWPDIYISNDYMAADYLFINNRNGTFTDRIGEMMSYTSEFSMGNDIADFNNDGWNDIYTLDMVPEDNHRQKLLSSIDNYEFFELRNKVGLHPQFMRNMLHLNNGNNGFSEIGQASGISNTDWSWSPLFADFDNDGWKDLFVANGFVHDYTNMDFLKFMGDFLRQTNYDLRNQNLLALAAKAPSSNVVNYLFKNNGDLTFKNMSSAWGMDKPSNSNGAAYGDLDNDGDLDLVINNTNQPAAIFRNDAEKIDHKNFLRLKLKGEKKNTLGVGTRVFAYSNGSIQSAEQLITRGYLSSVSPVLHLGLGNAAKLDSLRIIWPSGKMELLKGIAANTTLELAESKASPQFHYLQTKSSTLFHVVNNKINYTHQENPVNDFKRQPLLTAALSYSGPCMVKGDVNGDGMEDLYIGGPCGQPGALFLHNLNSSFTVSPQAAFIGDAWCEDTDACFADIDGDGDLDLYVCSGGYDRFIPGDPALQDRVYLNNGKGKFTKNSDALPKMLVSKSCVTAADINGDGAIDLFVGGRVIPGRYPETPQSFLLINDGKGHFKNSIEKTANSLGGAGMVTSAVFADMNADKQPDLVIAGEFMPIMVWINNKGQFINKTEEYFERPVSGCWNKIVLEDLNNDNRPDIIAGNMGLNSQLKCSQSEPAELYYKDFDDNGSVDPVLCYFIQGKSYPAISRDELLDQMSSMRTRFPDYKSYADATIKDIFSDQELQDAGHLKATSFASAVFMSRAGGKYLQSDLPFTAQQSPVFAIAIADVDADGRKDIILGGNVSHARLRFGFCEANQGTVLKGDNRGNFTSVSQVTTGLKIPGDIRSITVFGHTVLFGINNATITSYEF